jgi:hypothetical protein
MVDAYILKVMLSKIPQEMRQRDGLGSLETISFECPPGRGNVSQKFDIAPAVEQKPEPIGGTRRDMTQKQKTIDFFSRLRISLVGGVFLIGPMWLMVLHNTTWTALVSTSVMVLVWGAISAWRLDSPMSVLSTTAAYAAVLVVFVGTNSQSSATS